MALNVEMEDIYRFIPRNQENPFSYNEQSTAKNADRQAMQGQTDITNLRAIRDLNEIPTSIATPPQSPPGMPTLTSMLTNNNCVPPGLVMHMPCYLCKQPFSDVTKLSEHLILHAIEIHKLQSSEPSQMCEKQRPDDQQKDQNLQHKCPECSVSYKQLCFLRKHMRVTHGKKLSPASVAPPENQLGTQEKSTIEATPTKSYPKVLTTQQLNALAAADYNPQRDCEEKYLPSSPPSSGGFKKKQTKYAPHSPYFNANLWFYCDMYVP